MSHPPSWDGLIEDRFRAQVRARPVSPAVVAGDTVLTYRQLHRRAATAAAGLRRLGVTRETPVGLAFDRSADSIVALLAVVLAGGAYVPLDPAHPADRLARITEAARLRLVVCPDRVRERFTAPGPATTHGLGELSRLAAGDGAPEPDGASPPAPAGRSPLAYVMFTSGSTGRPKGVMVEHRGVLRLVTHTDYLDFSPRQRVLQAASLAFDAATFEIWGALLNGASLHVVDHETAVVPWRLGQALRDGGITLAWVTAPLFHRVAREHPAAFGSLTTLVTGGDVVSPGHVARVRAACPDLTVVNGYGPTENTTFTTTFPVPDGVRGPLPIGRPLPGTTVRICDERGRPVPAGTVGELYVAGAGLARGYLADPALTERAFVTLDGVRHYRTGDLVHADGDGLLHFHGRRDDQVKIRGHLVEPAEVNAALLALPGVTDAYTRVMGEPGGERSLTAYVVAPDEEAAVIRRRLRERLPGYLCPDRFVRLDRLPLSANGKVDRHALPVPPDEPAPRARRREPTDGEQELARLWADVLELDAADLGPDADFFLLGGDSLRLGVLLGRLQRDASVRLGYAEAFAAPTLDAMARAVATAAPAPADDLPGPAPGPAPLHPAQQGLFAVWQAEPDSLAYNVPVAVELTGPLDAGRLRDALTSVVAHEEALRMRFTVDGTGVRQEPAAPGAPEFTFLDAPDEAAVTGFVRPFAPDRPDGSPLLRALLVRTGAEDRHELYLDTHHIVFDGVSLRLLLTRLLAAYGGEEPPERAAGYRTAARWARERADRGADADHEDYWLRQLSDVPTEPVLPVDRPRGAHRAARGAVTSAVLDAGRHAAVRTAARRHRTTPFGVLFAAWAAALARLSGRTDFVVGTPTSGRTRPEFADVVGMFVNTACLRVRLTEDTTLDALVAQADRLAIGALSHQGPPYPRLARRLGMPPDPGRNPLFDVLFALQDIDFHVLRGAGLIARTRLLNPGTTRFDLNLQAYPGPDGLRLDLEYATDLYDHASAALLLGEYRTALDDLLTDPTAPVRRAYTATPAARLPDFDL
ncbi:non-ribosomal peptide synthetase [Streptomyces sp. NRRL S-31]|uniref:non-ribosomal peptide synthetase n=1 Tax=Streptomyces sp. NRRL S-31 TaxID=1463898 RepID=UPI0009A10873|nr:non-ribosomal peptide synthetase [Streptomyces sp. NRRL S-31]